MADRAEHSESEKTEVLPWTVKGVTHEARILAKESAQQRDLTLGSYLTSLIHQDAEIRQQLSALPHEIEKLNKMLHYLVAMQHRRWWQKIIGRKYQLPRRQNKQ